MLSHGRIWAAIDQLADAQRPDAVGAGAPRRARPDHLQPVEARRRRRPPALAVDREHRQDPRGDRHRHRRLPRLRASRRRRAAPASRSARCRSSASPRPAPAASSTMAASPPARAGTRSTFPAPPARTSSRSKVTGDSMLPLYRDGDTIIVARDAPCRRGDRVVVKTRDGEVMAKVLQPQDRRGRSSSPRSIPTIPTARSPSATSTGSARIIWASQ